MMEYFENFKLRKLIKFQDYPETCVWIANLFFDTLSRLQTFTEAFDGFSQFESNFQNISSYLVPIILYIHTAKKFFGCHATMLAYCLIHWLSHHPISGIRTSRKLKFYMWGFFLTLYMYTEGTPASRCILPVYSCGF